LIYDTEKIIEKFFVPGKKFSEYTTEQLEYFLQHNTESREIELSILALSYKVRFSPTTVLDGKNQPFETTLSENLQAIEKERIAIELELSKRFEYLAKHTRGETD